MNVLRPEEFDSIEGILDYVSKTDWNHFHNDRFCTGDCTECCILRYLDGNRNILVFYNQEAKEISDFRERVNCGWNVLSYKKCRDSSRLVAYFEQSTKFKINMLVDYFLNFGKLYKNVDLNRIYVGQESMFVVPSKNVLTYKVTEGNDDDSFIVSFGTGESKYEDVVCFYLTLTYLAKREENIALLTKVFNKACDTNGSVYDIIGNRVLCKDISKFRNLVV